MNSVKDPYDKIVNAHLLSLGRAGQENIWRSVRTP